MEAAREALQQGRYVDAVKSCKQVLKQDRSNYEGFVVLGLALVRGGQHLDQAEMSFKKAISLNPSALTAYQGLVELREASGNAQEILEAYMAAAEAAKASGDSSLVMEFIRKLALWHSTARHHEQAKLLWQEILGMNLSDQQRLEALCSLVDVEAAIMEENIQEYHREQELKRPTNSTSKSDSATMDSEDLLYCEALWARTQNCEVLESHARDVTQQLPYSDHYQNLLLRILIFKLRASAGQGLLFAKRQVSKHCLTMISTCPTKKSVDVLLAMCEEDDSEEVFQDLICPSSARPDETARMAWLGKYIAHLYPGRGIALTAAASGIFKSSRKEQIQLICQRELLADENSITGWLNLAKFQAAEGFHVKASECASKGLSAVARMRRSYGLVLKVAELQLRLIVAGSLLSGNRYVEGGHVFHKVAEEANDLSSRQRIPIMGAAFQGMVELSFAEKDSEMARSRLEHMLSLDSQNHWALSERGWLAFQDRNLDEAIAYLERAVSVSPDSAKYHYRLGRVYWEVEHTREKALSEFVESARIDPGQPDVFLYLGNYYRENAKDMRRAVRCFQKAVALNPENELAGEALSNILDSGGQYVLERSICHEASQMSPRAFWAWRRLGFIQVAEKNWSEAVATTQSALRGYPADASLWEALGLSYKKLGMFTAALKAYGRAFDLDSSDIFAALEMGTIHLSLSSFSKAIHVFRQALRILPDDLAATSGLASSLLGQTRECLTQGAFSWSSTLLKEAMELAYRNTLLYGHITAVWKQLGDTNLLYAQALPFDLDCDKFSTTELQSETFQQAVEFWHQERLNAAITSVHAYKRALHLLPNEGRLYRDVAIAMELVSLLGQKSHRPLQWSEAETFACGGLQLDAANPDMWVTFGLVTQHKGLQQHAFIQALRLNGNNAVAWAYLGQLYLNVHDEELAKLAFDRARSADPTLGLPWAGMSVLQSSRGRLDDVLEAFASCSYAIYLSSALELQAGIGQLAAQTQNLNLPQVNASLQQATQRQPLQAEAHNLKGLSCESRGDFQSAITAFKRARAAVALSSESSDLQNISVTCNLARVLCKAGYGKAAVMEYEQLLAIGALNESHELRGYAVALSQNDQKHLAERIAKQALSAGIIPDANYAAAIALHCKLVYFNQGPAAALDVLSNVPDALFLHKELCLTTISLGIATCKRDLLSAAIHRCRPIFLSEYAPEAYFLLASGNQAHIVDSGGTRNLIKALHMYPQSDRLRGKLGHMLLSQSHGLKPNLVERLCCTDAISSDDGLYAMVLTDAAIACGVECKDMAFRRTEVTEQLQKLVHKEPWNVMARYCLILFLMQQTRREKYPHHLCQAILRMSRTALIQLSASHNSSYMRAELELCVSECTLQDGDSVAALDHAKLASDAAKEFPSIELATVLQLGRCHLEDSSSGKAAITGWHKHASKDNLLSQLSLIDLELRWQLNADKSIIRFRQMVQKGALNEQMWMALLEFVLAGFYLLKDDLQSSEDVAGRAVSLWPDNPVLYLFHGSICMELVKNGNPTNFLPKVISSLSKAVRHSNVPVACALLAQAEFSKDSSRSSSIKKWASNLRKEFLTWPGDPRPAELYFQMALLAKQSLTRPEGESSIDYPEIERSHRSWLQQALHMNPACSRYWVLSKQLLIQS